jgi:recombination protein RecT
VPAALKDKLDKATEQTTAKGGSQLLALTEDETVRKQLALALPVGQLTAERLLRVARTEMLRNPKLLDCTRASVLDSLMIAAHLGLEVGGPLGHFYLVPFRDTKNNVSKATPILGYRGIIVLARRSGEVEDVVARAVYENDKFNFAYGLDDELVHVPADGDQGRSVKFYGIARYTNGGHLIMVMTRQQVEKFRSRSKMKDQGAWVDDYDAMACKTVIRRMASYMPLATESAEAIAEDEAREVGYGSGEIIDMPHSEANGGEAQKGKQGEASDPPHGETQPAENAARTPASPSEAAPGPVTGSASPDAAAAAPPTGPAACPICGETEDLTGHLKHNDAKHVAWAVEQRKAKESKS